MNFEHTLSSQDTYKLSDLISRSHDPISLTLTIEGEKEITVIDDIYDKPLEVTFIVKKNSWLLYRHRFTQEEREQRSLSARSEPEKAPSLSKKCTVILSEPEAKAHLECINESFGYDFFSFKTIQHHRAPHTESLVTTRNVVHDSARFFSENLIRIEKEAQHTKAREETKNLILGNNARVISIPKLEVEADLVSCEHGAAISKISDEDLFYFQTRGISIPQAKNILIKAFLL
jgi:hypothetical protein